MWSDFYYFALIVVYECVVYISFGTAWKVLLLIHNCQHCTAHLLKNIFENYQVMLFFFFFFEANVHCLPFSCWLTFILSCTMIISKCPELYTLSPLEHISWKEFLWHPYIKYYCINTESKYSTSLFWPQIMICLQSICYLWPLNVLICFSPEVNTGCPFGGISKV